MKLSDLSVNRPVTTIVIFIAIVVLGVYSLGRLAIELIPDISFPVIFVWSEYPGVAPQEVEENLTKVLENSVAAASNVKKITSESQEGSSSITIEYEWGTDMSEAAAELREKLDVVRDFLPDEASEPLIFKFDPSQIPVMILVVEGERSLKSLRYRAETDIKRNLEQIDGVANVMIWGGQERQVQIDLDRTLLASYNLTVDQVIQIIQSEHMNVSGGTVDEGDTTFSLRTVGKFGSIDEIERMVVLNQNGIPVYLRDVANIVDGYLDEKMDAKVGGEDGIIMVIQRQSGTNTVQIARRIEDKLEALERSMPSDMVIRKFYSPADFIVESINNVWQVALIGGVFAVFVLFIFLRNIPTTLVISVSIPLSIITTFIFMYFFDLTINMMSLGGLALGIGMLVDNSIVVLENIFRYREFGSKPKEASKLGVHEMSKAIIASTLTTVTVFLPLVLFIKGLASELFRDLAFTVTFSLLSSLLVALTVIPMLTSRIKKIELKRSGSSLKDIEKEIAGRGKMLRWLDSMYSDVLNWALRRKWVFLLLVFLLLAGSVWSVRVLSVEFIPQSDESFIQMVIRMPVGTRLDATRRVVNDIYGFIENEVPERDVVFYQVGRTGEMAGIAAPDRAELWMTLVEPEKRSRSDREIIDMLRTEVKQIPGVTARFSTGGGAGGESGNLSVAVRGYDLDHGLKLAKQVQEIMGPIKNVNDVRISREEGLPELRILVDRDRAAQFGIRAVQIGFAIQHAFTGKEVASVILEGEEVEVLVRLQESDRLTPADLDLISIVNPMGMQVPLSNLVRIEQGYGPVTIERERQERVVYVNARVQGDVKGAVDSIRAEVNKLAIPAGFNVIYGGTWEDIQETIKDLALVGLLSIILVYLIMAALFESFFDPFIIMFTLPMSFIGVVWMHIVTGTSFNAMSGIGVVMLLGIVVNNGIILVDYTNLLRKRGFTLQEAVRLAGRTRLRPIFMTMMTTVLGLTPMALAFGSGSEMRAPMARTVIGGLLVSTIFTLVLIPVLYAMFESRRQKRRQKRKRREEVR
jgi:HAE1 family hydrophobic/amphiphilic exporter-1